MSDSEWRREIERCRREIAEIEGLLRRGHPDVEGLCQALSDWSAELRLLKQERRLVTVSVVHPPDRERREPRPA